MGSVLLQARRRAQKKQRKLFVEDSRNIILSKWYFNQLLEEAVRDIELENETRKRCGL